MKKPEPNEAVSQALKHIKKDLKKSIAQAKAGQVLSGDLRDLIKTTKKENKNST